jgi:type IV pilus assembly protein PilY1
MDLSGSETDQRNLIAFLRGQSVSGLRSRDPASVLGDIVNSTPRVVKDANFGNAYLPATIGAASTPTGAGSYAAYLKDKSSRSEGVIAFGANDGMFHLVESNDGKEVFAFIPRAVLPRLKNLAAVPYVHQFTVDGPSTEGDVYDAASSQWNNILVVTAGAGARSVFALHLPTTAPTSLNPASDVLWEFDATDNGDLGYVLGAPQVGMLPNGRWVTVFGNGFDSNDGHAVLFVCDALAGCDKSSAITVSSDSGNGLGGVVLVRDASNVIRGAYAGDLKGNVWKFVTGVDGNLQVDFGGAPLFTATSDVDGKPQPITAAPAYALNDHGGTVVIVSTGRLYSDDDATSKDHQTIYGLFDPAPIGVGTSTPPVIIPTDLVHEQSDASTLADKGYFTITATSVPTAPKGWMLDMSLANGERGIYAPRFIYGVAEVETVVPGGTGVESCAQTANHYVYYLLNPLTGGQLRVRVVDAYDLVVGGFAASGSGESGILMQEPGGGPEAVIKLLGHDGPPAGLTFGKPPNEYIWAPVLNPPPNVH